MKVRPVACSLFAGLALSVAAFASVSSPVTLGEIELPAAHDADGNIVTTYAVVDGESVEVPPIRMGDPAIIARIFDEGINRSQVMGLLGYLCEDIGVRLTGSTACETANRWSLQQFESWGLEGRLSQWGEIGMRYDRGQCSGKAYLGRNERDIKGLTTLSWATGTDGPVRGRAVRMPTTPEEFEAVKDMLEGAWVIVPSDPSGHGRSFGSANSRYRERAGIRESGNTQIEQIEIPDDAIAGPWDGAMQIRGRRGYGCKLSIEKHADGTVSGTMGFGEGTPGEIEGAEINGDSLTFEYETSRGRSKYEFHPTPDGGLSGTSTSLANPDRTFTIEMGRPVPSMFGPVMSCNPAGYVSSSNSDLVWTSGISGWRDLTLDTLAKDVEVVISESDYDYINSKLADGGDVELEFDINADFEPGPIPVYNTIAEIRGTEHPEQVVIVSGHLDSWDGPGAQGATDNATGCAVTMEAARILTTVGAQPKRTIRFILWTGEEQGLLGSRAYVESLSDDERANIVCCLVDDGGTNSEGGMHAIGSQRDYLAAATAPINGRVWDDVDGKYLNVDVQLGEKMPQGGGSDHASFNAIGIPGYFWDEVGRQDYNHAHHTQYDTIEYAIPNYLRQSATNAAIVAYNLACAPDILPREVKPEANADSQ